MGLQLNNPYKIIDFKQKRYDEHYNIPSAESLIVPVENIGDEVLCDIRWENENGELKVLHKKMFICDNLIRLDPLVDVKLFEIWSHYYDEPALN